ncbi:hypothetical protein BH20ACT18_BH20ACT18_06030 [soil metagenome]
MGVTLQIRDVPEDVHQKLKKRAEVSGKSLSQYVREMLERNASRPTTEEFLARLATREPVKLSEPSEVLVRKLRDHGE